MRNAIMSKNKDVTGSGLPFDSERGDRYLPDLQRVTILTTEISRYSRLTSNRDFIQEVSKSIGQYDDGQFYYERRCADYNSKQSLGRYNASPGSFVRIIEFNGHHYLRKIFEEQGIYDDSNHPKPRSKNFLRPSLIAGFDYRALRQLCFERLAQIVELETRSYVEDFERAYGRVIRLESVATTISSIELAWDIEDDRVPFIPRGIRDSWENYFSSTSEAKIKEDLMMLEAHPVNGRAHKLYIKALDIIRYEVELRNEYLRRTVPHKIDVTDPIQVDSLLAPIAKFHYEELLVVQSASMFPEEISPLELFIASIPRSSRLKMRTLLAELLAKGYVHNKESTYRRELNRLREAGWVEYAGKGIWRLVPCFASQVSRLGTMFPFSATGNPIVSPPPPTVIAPATPEPETESYALLGISTPFQPPTTPFPHYEPPAWLGNLPRDLWPAWKEITKFFYQKGFGEHMACSMAADQIRKFAGRFLYE